MLNTFLQCRVLQLVEYEPDCYIKEKKKDMEE